MWLMSYYGMLNNIMEFRSIMFVTERGSFTVFLSLLEFFLYNVVQKLYYKFKLIVHPLLKCQIHIKLSSKHLVSSIKKW